jgi:hypothetical protein
VELAHITPVLLTFDEAPNIGRTLGQLSWAERVVVLDSGSRDETPSMVRSFPNAELHERTFDSHAAQWTHAVHATGITTEWVLALDADYFVPDAFVAELRALAPADNVAGYRCRFRYCVHGKPIRGSLYPPVIVLYRRTRTHYVQDGHTQRLVVDGEVGDLATPLLHDDRKPRERFAAAQARYAALEADKIRRTPFTQLSWPDRVRLVPYAGPVAAVLYAGVLRGCVLDGRAGLAYLRQRALAEWLLLQELRDR